VSSVDTPEIEQRNEGNGKLEKEIVHFAGEGKGASNRTGLLALSRK
jgi:hypothetical protein